MLLLKAAFENLPLCIKRTPFHQKRTRFQQNLLTLSGFKLNVSSVDATECGLADAGLISGAALGQVNQKVTSFQLGRNCSSNRRPNQGLGQFSSSSLPKRCSRSGREQECLVDNLLDLVQGLTRSNKNNGSAMLVRTLLAPVVVQPEASPSGLAAERIMSNLDRS